MSFNRRTRCRIYVSELRTGSRTSAWVAEIRAPNGLNLLRLKLTSKGWAWLQAYPMGLFTTLAGQTARDARGRHVKARVRLGADCLHELLLPVRFNRILG